MFISAAELNSAGSFPGYTANGQETSSGLVTLNKTDEAPKAPEPQGAAIKPPVLSAKDAEATLVKKIAQTADSKKGGLKERAQDLVNKGPRIAQLYRRPGLRKYAALDGSATQAKRLIEEAKRNPALMKRVDPRGVLQQALKKDAPRNYNQLKEAPQLAPKPAGAPTITVSHRQLRNKVAALARKAKAVVETASALSGIAAPAPVGRVMAMACNFG